MIYLEDPDWESEQVYLVSCLGSSLTWLRAWGSRFRLSGSQSSMGGSRFKLSVKYGRIQVQALRLSVKYGRIQVQALSQVKEPSSGSQSSMGTRILPYLTELIWLRASTGILPCLTEVTWLRAWTRILPYLLDWEPKPGSSHTYLTESLNRDPPILTWLRA